MENDLRRMLVVGITYNKVERGVYALILQELGGSRRLPIVIGMSEAQSIECKLQEIITPRPLTHDLMANILRAFGLNLKYVVIKQLDGGIFAADLHLADSERSAVIDARSSDGISLALRMGVPIYASEDLLVKVGLEQKQTKTSDKAVTDTSAGKGKSTEIADANTEDFWQSVGEQSIEKQEDLLARFVSMEEYEMAARLRDIIQKRKEENSDSDK